MTATTSRTPPPFQPLVADVSSIHPEHAPELRAHEFASVFLRQPIHQREPSLAEEIQSSSRPRSGRRVVKRYPRRARGAALRRRDVGVGGERKRQSPEMSPTKRGGRRPPPRCATRERSIAVREEYRTRGRTPAQRAADAAAVHPSGRGRGPRFHPWGRFRSRGRPRAWRRVRVCPRQNGPLSVSVFRGPRRRRPRSARWRRDRRRRRRAEGRSRASRPSAREGREGAPQTRNTRELRGCVEETRGCVRERTRLRGAQDDERARAPRPQPRRGKRCSLRAGPRGVRERGPRGDTSRSTSRSRSGSALGLVGRSRVRVGPSRRATRWRRPRPIAPGRARGRRRRSDALDDRAHLIRGGAPGGVHRADDVELVALPAAVHARHRPGRNAADGPRRARTSAGRHRTRRVATMSLSPPTRGRPEVSRVGRATPGRDADGEGAPTDLDATADM